jgi:hypothetical protein
MAIRLDAEDKDAQGFPVVTWEEDRNLFAPDGFGRARVTCFIQPDAQGVLQFVSAGSVRHGAYEKARPWDKLISFTQEPAEQLYPAAADRARVNMLTNKSKSETVRVLATDGAQVMLANFADARPGVPMHLNCAECTKVEMALLLDQLSREFIANRIALLDEKCAGSSVWPKGTPFFPHKTPAPVSVSRTLVRVVDLAIIGVLGLIGWGLYWVIGR